MTTEKHIKLGIQTAIVSFLLATVGLIVYYFFPTLEIIFGCVILFLLIVLANSLMFIILATRAKIEKKIGENWLPPF
ncbi:MAG: hypothetical protein J0M08_04175 [Bacteroidetes bacterium]|nr:hypothetical protein [Bacteroidota bacterium]